MDSKLNPSVANMAGIPYECVWDLLPAAYGGHGDNALSITAGPRTDLFTDPRGEITIANSPRLLFAPKGDCTLRAKVSVEFASTYDAGVLLVYSDSRRWAKLCFEFSPQGQPMVVSVVNKGESDDCNSVTITGRTVHLRLARLANAFAFHYSLDGKLWHLVRYFNLYPHGTNLLGAAKFDGENAPIQIGFSSQSPTGEGCTATFQDIVFADDTLGNIRSGE